MDRHITTLDNEQAALPLRLTGDGVSYHFLWPVRSQLLSPYNAQPWRVKYKHTDRPEKVLSATVSSANGELLVSEKGTYELVEVRSNPVQAGMSLKLCCRFRTRSAQDL